MLGLKSLFKISGIYAVRNKITGQLYVGSAVHIGNRFHNHRKYLRKNKHPNKYLQNAWNKYWEPSFEFIILEYVECLSLLLHCEDSWIEQTKCYNKEYGYNTRRLANSNLGLKPSLETKKKQSLAHKGHSRNRGYKHTEEAKLKVSIANKGKPKPHFRNSQRWPHSDGWSCKCLECKAKKNELEKERLLVIRRENGIEPIRKIDKWPHKDGSLCPCNECKTKRSARSLEGYHRRKNKDASL